MKDWIWIASDVAAAIHDRQLAEHGGPAGLRNPDGLESALAPPRNLAVYGNPDGPALGAAYAFAIARNHPFVDGNKRTAWILCRLFLRLNGLALAFEARDAIGIMLDLASGEIAQEELAEWLRERIALAH